jgi:hypothetical protein
MSKPAFYFILAFALSGLISDLLAQSNISGVVNTYAPLTNINPTKTVLTLGTLNGTGSFAAGDEVLVIQMKGASIDDTESANYGQILNYNDAGNYELATIASVSGNDLTLTQALAKSFTISGLVQIIKIPQYNSGAIVTAGGLNGLAWNGSSGGVLSIRVNGTLTLNGAISMDGMGFRGGSFSTPAGDCSITTYRTNGTHLGYKGEGIAIEPNGNLNGRGPLANGGGGGNGHNAGGGGGSLAGGGSTGGRQWAGDVYPGWCGVQDGSCSNPNNLVGGIGGKVLDTSLNKLFLGGGGGGGQQDNNVSSNGGNGGGLILIFANQIVGNGNLISANGSTALNATWDGAGGGGSGGVVVLECNSFSGNLTVRADGGNGGNTSGCHGPGGGGGGGFLQFTANMTNFSSVIRTANPGANGTQPDGQTCGSPAVAVGNGFCGISSFQSAGIIIEQAPLPISLVFFKGQKLDNYHLLWWQTSLEENNAYFSIERSTDGRNFQSIGRIDGSGNHVGLKEYRFRDYNSAQGMNYYRLRQVDFDGTSTLSMVIALHNEQASAIQVYPNPTLDGLIKIKGLNQSPSICQLLDSQGQILWTKKLESQDTTFDLSQMPRGIYILAIQDGGKIWQKKIVKQ